MGEASEKYHLVTVTVARTALSQLNDLEAAARLSGLGREMILELCYAGHLRPCVLEEKREEFFFDDNALYLMAKAYELGVHHGVNSSGVGIIIALLKELERLEREVKFLRDRSV